MTDIFLSFNAPNTAFIILVYNTVFTKMQRVCFRIKEKQIGRDGNEISMHATLHTISFFDTSSTKFILIFSSYTTQIQLNCFSLNSVNISEMTWH